MARYIYFGYIWFRATGSYLLANNFFEWEYEGNAAEISFITRWILALNHLSNGIN